MSVRNLQYSRRFTLTLSPRERERATIVISDLHIWLANVVIVCCLSSPLLSNSSL